MREQPSRLSRPSMRRAAPPWLPLLQLGRFAGEVLDVGEWHLNGTRAALREHASSSDQSPFPNRFHFEGLDPSAR